MTLNCDVHKCQTAAAAAAARTTGLAGGKKKRGCRWEVCVRTRLKSSLAMCVTPHGAAQTPQTVDLIKQCEIN